MKKAIFMILLSFCLLSCLVLSSCKASIDNDESAATTQNAATVETAGENATKVTTSETVAENATTADTTQSTTIETERESFDEEQPITDGQEYSKLGFVDGDPIENEAQFDEILARKLSYEDESGSRALVTVTVYIQLDYKAEDVYDAKTAMEAIGWEHVDYRYDPTIIAQLPEPYDMTDVKELTIFDAVTAIRVKVQVDYIVEDIIWNP